MNHKPWFKVWQDQILSDSNYRNLSLQACGLLLNLWLECARHSNEKFTRNGGELKEMFHNYQGFFWRFLTELEEYGWIKREVNGVLNTITVIGWVESQESMAESKKRASRRERARTVRNVSAPLLEGEGEVEGEGDKDKKPPIVPRGGRDNGKYSLDFEEFYKAYPRHIGKKAAWKAYLKSDIPQRLVILVAIERQKRSQQWQDPKYIPHPATWLNQSRWEDEVEVDPKEQEKINLEESRKRLHEKGIL